MRKRPFLIGVIGTEMQGIEQQRILCGIIEQAQQEHTNIAVLSNLFNPLEPELGECAENRIYSLVLSSDLDAVIVLSESLVNEALRGRIRDLLLQIQNTPVLLVGAELPGFDFPCISTSDANDFEEITDHLIDCHGYRDIMLLTGPLSLNVSRIRIAGYRRSLEKHGIPFDESKVCEGDFWYQSGCRLAEAFIRGEKPVPEAVICANDYMAFGMLDAFDSADVNVLGKTALVGYEFIPERNLHTPILTTYRRNRTALGKTAVQILLNTLREAPQPPFTPPHGSLIPGVTCGCSVASVRQHEELSASRLVRQFSDWSLKSDMERQLTECTDMDSLMHTIGEFMFLMQDVSDAVICLPEDWHSQEPVSETLLCRSVNPWTDHTVFRLKRTELAGITARSSQSGVCFWLPLAFGERLLGYCVLRYDAPHSIDDVCRSWVKSVTNGLEYLRLKSDVRYLLQCRVLSGAYDSMTGMFSRDGLRNACRLMQNTDGADGITAVLLRCIPEKQTLYSEEEAKHTVKLLLAAAGVIRQFQSGICGRIAEHDYLLLYPAKAAEPKILRCAVTAELLCVLDIGAFLCIADSFPHDTPPDSLLHMLEDAAGRCADQRAAAASLPHYAALSAFRSEIYQAPADAHTIEENAAALGFNPDYFNRKYKACFGLSFHQDCIRSRVLYAAHLLMQTKLSITETAERCGYSESKYFIRQFSAVSGCPPKAFRRAAAGFTDAEMQ